MDPVQASRNLELIRTLMERTTQYQLLTARAGLAAGCMAGVGALTFFVLDAGNPGSGKLPAGALQVRTDYGRPGYGGPCPPQGDHPHRYLFTIFAVGAEQLPVTADTSAAVVGFQLHFNTLAKAELMGLFKH